jgi:hypothetical protein
MAFIDAHREDLRIEPICWELAIAPYSYHEHAARLADPGRRCLDTSSDTTADTACTRPENI